MVTVNLLSDCVSRDTCNLSIESGDVRVMQYPGFSSAYSMISKKPAVKASFTMLEHCESSPFYKRSFVLDFNKEILDYLFAKKSDYLIMSFANNLTSLLRKDDHIFSFPNGVKELLKDAKITAEIALNSYEKVSPYDISDKEWEYNVGMICDTILSQYTVDQIIYQRHFPVPEYETADGCLKSFYLPIDNTDKMNRLIQIADNVALKKLKGCHVIEFPDNVTGYEKHWFGNYWLHYIKEYYQYAAEALKIIFKKLPSHEEAVCLERLRQGYNDWFGLRYEHLKLKTEHNQLELRLTSECLPLQDVKGSIEETLRVTKSIRAYLDLLTKIKSRCLIILSVKDTPGNDLPDDVINRLHEFGFKSFSKELWKTYIGVSMLSEIICDKAGEKQEDPTSFDYANEELKISVLSKSFRNGNIASVVINGRECAVNIRGINIVVYDLNGNSLIDSVALDAHGRYWTFKRK